MVVIAPATPTSRIVGTRFTVDCDGTDHVDVRVTEGEVKVTRHHQETRVAAGSAWKTEQGLRRARRSRAEAAAEGIDSRLGLG